MLDGILRNRMGAAAARSGAPCVPTATPGPWDIPPAIGDAWFIHYPIYTGCVAARLETRRAQRSAQTTNQIRRRPWRGHAQTTSLEFDATVQLFARTKRIESGVLGRNPSHEAFQNMARRPLFNSYLQHQGTRRDSVVTGRRRRTGTRTGRGHNWGVGTAGNENARQGDTAYHFP